MAFKHIALSLVAFLLLVVTGVSLSWAGNGLSDEEILERVQLLSQQKEMPEDKAFKLKRSIETLLHDKDFREIMARTPVTGVMVYRTGEGGLVLKIVKGDGLASLQDRQAPLEFTVESWQVGAHVGGAVVWGAALVLGLRDPGYFGGTYVGQNTSATAADTSTSDHILLRLADPPSEAQAHNLMLVQAAMGLSANAGDYKLNIIPR